MSSADFPGSSWQDGPGLPDGLGRRYQSDAGQGRRAAQTRASSRQQPRRAAHAGRTGRPQADNWPEDNASGNGWRLAASRTADGYRGGSGNGRSPGRVAGSPRSAGQSMPARRGGGPGGGGNGWDGGDGFYRPSRGRGRSQRPSHWPWRASWWKHWTIKKVALLLGGTVALVVLLAVGAFLVAYASVQVPLSALSKPLDQSSVVYFAGGKKVVGTFASQNRTVLTQAQVAQAKNLTAAVFAAEDRHYETEGGISITSTVRAALVDISGSGFQGASTITEQLVKNYFDPGGTGNLTYKSKLKEIIVAIKLSKIRSKSWILTNYLNTIYFGSGAYGAQAAAQTYFGRSAWDLNVAQAAMIAAMINQPGQFDPYGTGQWHTALVDRWKYVLGNMVGDGAITQQQANGQLFPKVVKSRPSDNWTGYRGYIMYLVQNELESQYGYSQDAIYSGGLKIYTTINKRLMNELYHAVYVNKLQMANGSVPLSTVHIGAVLEKPGTGQILAFYGGPGFGVKHCKALRCQLSTELDPQPVGSSFKPYVLATAVAQGMDVQNSVMNSHSPLCIPPDWNLTYQHELSKKTANCPYPGFPFTGGGEDTKGNDTVPQATAFSNDPAFEDLIHRTTVQQVINTAADLGVSPADVTGLNELFGNNCQHLLKQSGLPQCFPGAINSALGGGPLTAVDQANTFATLVSGGHATTPHVISYLVQNGTTIRPRLRTWQAFQNQGFAPPQVVAANTDYALSFDTTLAGATGQNAYWPGHPTIAKTGTLGQGNKASEAWFIGAVPQYSLSVTLFTDQPGRQYLDGLPAVTYPAYWQGSYGGAWPATIWRTFMTSAFANLAPAPLPTPSFTGYGFTPWIQANPVVAPKKHCHGHGQGQGQGNGGPGPGACPTPGPGPSGGPTPPPTQSPTPPLGQQLADRPNQSPGVLRR